MLNSELLRFIKEEPNITEDLINSIQRWQEVNPNHKVYLYGAGWHMQYVVQYMTFCKIEIELILDTYREGFYNNIPIVLFSKFLEEHRSSDDCWFIISAPSKAKDISKVIREGVSQEALISCCEMYIYKDFVPNLESYRVYLAEHWDELANMSEDLSDRFSVETLDNVIRGRISGNIDWYHKCFVEEQYYSKDIITFGSKEVMVELGSYNGDTLLEFIDKCPNYKAIYCMEPDDTYFERLTSTVAKHDKKRFDNETGYIRLIKKGAWDKECYLLFSTGQNGSGSVVLETVEGDKMSVCMSTVDKEINEPITFLKMDIEGAELMALKGAKNHILNDRPKLAVSVYHKPEDIIDIWKYLKKLVPDYHFYLRHHAKDAGTDTVLYAVE